MKKVKSVVHSPLKLLTWPSNTSCESLFKTAIDLLKYFPISNPQLSFFHLIAVRGKLAKYVLQIFGQIFKWIHSDYFCPFCVRSSVKLVNNFRGKNIHWGSGKQQEHAKARPLQNGKNTGQPSLLMLLEAPACLLPPPLQCSGMDGRPALSSVSPGTLPPSTWQFHRSLSISLTLGMWGVKKSDSDMYIY